MRVISGQYKSRKLVTPEGLDITRPTGDRVKESLFNILAFELEDTAILDLFAGSGSLGIEALSRGAAKVVFVENHKQALACLKKNLETLNVSKETGQIVPKKVEDYLAIGHHSAQKFDIIFADPPYDSQWLENGGLEQLEASDLCAEQCLLVFERAAKDRHSKDPSTHLQVQNWTLQDVRKYGKTQLEFWRRNYD